MMQGKSGGRPSKNGHLTPKTVSKTGFLVLEITKENLLGSNFAVHCSMRVSFHYAGKKWVSYIKKWAFDPKNSQKLVFWS